MNKCQKFTPTSYVETLLDNVGYNGKKILKKTFLENSCGEGNILVVAVERYIIAALAEKLPPKEISKDLHDYFIAFEIDKEIVDKCISKLNDLITNYDLPPVNWNIVLKDYLRTKVEQPINYIVGNPPYIMYQELDDENREYLKNNFDSCEKGKFDYCYAFIEKSIKDLIEGGEMSYLIPNSIFKNSFGLNLREIMKEYLYSIIDFPHTPIFSDAMTTSAIIRISKNEKKDYIEYTNTDQSEQIKIMRDYLLGKWIFTIDYQAAVIEQQEEHRRFGDYYLVSNSVATLANKVFVLSDFKKNGSYFVHEDFKIELSVIKKAASPRGLSRNIKEFIIFPYKINRNVGFSKYSNQQFLEAFPETTRYLKENEKILSNRKADGKWFEYGRSQALNKIGKKKLMMSSIITEKINVYELGKSVIPYSGFFITSPNGFSLEVAKKILESKQFYEYILKRAINANGRSVRCSVKDIMNFPVDDFID